MFPGIQIKEDVDKIVFRILTTVNPDSLPPYEALCSWERVDDRIYDYDWLRTDMKFFLLYKHPVHDYMDKLFEVDGADLVQFMRENIDHSRMEGIDMIVSSADFNHSFVCNHDGEVYLAS